MKRFLIAVLTVAGVAGCTSSGDTAGTPTPSAPVTTPASSAAAAPRTIPVAAFYELPGNQRPDRKEANGSAAVPSLCGGELAPGAGVVSSAALMTLYQTAGAPPDGIPEGVLYQTIRSYEADNADGFVDRAREALASCTSFKNGESTVRVETKPLPDVGDEAFTVDLIQPQRDLPGNLTGGDQTNRIAVMRFGLVVTILYDAEYERSSSDPKNFDTFVQGAAKAIGNWRG